MIYINKIDNFNKQYKLVTLPNITNKKIVSTIKNESIIENTYNILGPTNIPLQPNNIINTRIQPRINR